MDTKREISLQHIKIDEVGLGISNCKPCSWLVVLKIVFFILLLSMSVGGAAAAEPKILALQSAALAPYEQAMKGFEQAFNSQVHQVFISNMKEKEILQLVRKLRPDMVLAMGRDALSLSRQIKAVPVVYCMVLNPQTLVTGEKNIGGVSMNLPPEKQLGELIRVIPAVKNISLLYEPGKSGAYVQRLREVAEEMNVSLTVGVVRRPTDVPRRLSELKGRSGIYWMLPDTTLITPETLEALFLFSLENKMPVLTFANQYLEQGAALSIGIDPYDIGSQAGELAQKTLSGGAVENGTFLDARKAVVTINKNVALKLGVMVDQKFLNNYRVGH